MPDLLEDPVYLVMRGYSLEQAAFATNTGQTTLRKRLAAKLKFLEDQAANIRRALYGGPRTGKQG